MNFGLNKIDTDIRRKIYDETKDGIIHRKSEVIIQKDEENNRDKSFDKIIDNKKNKRRKKENENTDKNENHKEVQIKGQIVLDKESGFCGSFLDVKK